MGVKGLALTLSRRGGTATVVPLYFETMSYLRGQPRMTATAPAPASVSATSQVMVRPASISDMARKVEISTWYSLNTLGDAAARPTSLERTTHNFLVAKEKGYPYLVAELDGYVVGYTYLRDYNDEPRKAELSLYVDHDYLYRGIGSRLLHKILDVLEDPAR